MSGVTSQDKSYLGNKAVSRRTLLRSGLTLAAGLAAAYAVGCGDDDESAPASTTSAQSGTAVPTPAPTSAPAAPTSSATPPVAAPMAPGWRQIAAAGTLPSARHDHSLVADAAGSRVYLFGGRTGGETLGDLWVYDLEAATWSQLAAGGGPAARFGHNAILDPSRGRVVVFGGQAGGAFFSDVWAYDPAADSWSEVAAEGAGPAQRYGAGGALDPSGAMLISHGFTNQGRFDDTWEFNLDAQQWSDGSPTQGERPLRRCLLRTVVDTGRNRMLLFGGQSNQAPFHGDLWAFDLAGRSWSELTGGPSPRNLYSAVVREDQPTMLLFGGNTESGESNELWALDLTSDQWTSVAVDAPPSPRSGHDAAWLLGRNTMLLFGGNDVNGDLNDLWELAI